MPARKRNLKNLFGLLGGDEPVRTFAEVNGVVVSSLDDVYAALASSSVVHVSRSDANRVPAVVATRNRLVAAITGMDLVQIGPENQVVTRPWLKTPNPNMNRPRVNEIKDTIWDLFYEGVAYWRVTSRSSLGGISGSGFPLTSEWISQDRVQVQEDGSFTIDGKDVPNSEIIVFEGLHKGILHEGATSAINDALRLARAAALFTNSPFPLGWFTDSEPGAGLEQGEIDEFLSEWTSHRRRNAWAYVPGDLKLEMPDFDPAKLQLADARRETVVDVARGTGADLEGLGISTTSRSYFNATQVRKDFLDYVASMYTRVIEERLSRNDVTAEGHVVRFDFDDFLRTDALTRMQTFQIGLQIGAFADEDEIRAEEGKPPLTPAQLKARKERSLGQSKPTDTGGSPSTVGKPSATQKETT